MKKTVFIVILSFALLIVSFSFAVFSVGDANYAEIAPGGEISSAADVKAVFGVENVTVNTEGETVNIYFENSVKLSSPVVIKSGSYKINGRDCKLYRGFENGALVLLDGSEGGAPRLVIEEPGTTDWETGATAVFTFDGNREQYPRAIGALIALKGNATLELDGKVMFKNAVNSELGGAIYAEAVTAGSGAESKLYAPTVSLKTAKITDCASLKGGGGIALLGGTDGKGEVALTDVIIEKCRALNDLGSAMGGGFYLSGGSMKLSGACQIAGNESNIGGGGYVCGFAEIEGASIKENKATVSGGALYCGKGTAVSGSIAMNNTILSYNVSDGNGGAIYNEGTLLVGGSTYINDCRAKGDGGGVYNLGSFGFSSGDIIINKAGGMAGAIYNGESGILIVSGGRISSNEAPLCGGIYSEGSFEFKGGSIGKNVGSAPQDLVCGIMKMSGNATFTDTEVLGILLKKDAKPTVINVSDKLTSRVKQTLAFFAEEEQKDGTVAIKLANKSGMTVFSSENAEAMSSAVKGFKVYGEGLKNHKIKSDGTLSFKMPLMPLWAWILSVSGIVVATVVAVFAVKRIKKNRGCKSL